MTVSNAVTLPLKDFKPEHFLLEVTDKVATITLNRPERKNPLTFESYAELSDTFLALQRDKSITAVVVTGAGGNFCSGGDVFEIIGPLLERDMVGLLDFTRMTGDLIKAMKACPQPVIAAIDGICAGAGSLIATAADMRLGTEGAKVAFLFNRVGLAGCDMGACAMLPRIIGYGRASELLYTGRSMKGDEAERWGFFNRLCAPENVLGEAQELAKSLAEGPSFANAMTKRMLEMEWDMSLNQAIEAEALAQSICMQTQDYHRAFNAFANKQRPVFEGN